MFHPTRCITSHFSQLLRTRSNRPILKYKEDKQWVTMTRNDLKHSALYCRNILLENKINAGDRVMYVGENNYNWISWNMATHSLGGIFVPTYANQSDAYISHIIDDCKPKLVIGNTSAPVYPLSAYIDTRYREESDLPICHDGDLATLIYTSGTTGKPKGVMLSHKNILSNLEGISKRFSDINELYGTTTSLSILPWAHIYGLTTELYYNLLMGNVVAIASSPQEFVTELREIRPQMLYLVPKILEMIKDKLSIFDRPILRHLQPIILRRIFGGRLITIFVGGSKLNEGTREFYKRNGISICEGFGCTETSPLISVNHPIWPRRDDSIGKILDNLIVEIIDGEICVAGDSVMNGYYNNTIATREAFVQKGDKWFYKTGDKGECIDNFLYYKGRMKDNYKLSNGKFVNVHEVESIVKSVFEKTCMLYGLDKNYNILIVEDNLDDKTLETINSKLDSYLQIRKILQVEAGSFENFMTPKRSIQRNKVIEYFSDEIDEVYS